MYYLEKQNLRFLFKTEITLSLAACIWKCSILLYTVPYAASSVLVLYFEVHIHIVCVKTKQPEALK